jgi:protein SCO1/2
MIGTGVLAAIMMPAAMPAVVPAGSSLATLDVAAALASESPPPPGTPAWAEGADVTEHLGARLPLELAFTGAQGQKMALGSLFDGTHPVLLVLAYYECPQLCSLVLDGAAAAMQTLDRQGFRVGREYRVATISFDATERIDQAARKQASVLARLGRGDLDAWPFLVGSTDSVRALTQALGFAFLRDPRTGALAHAAVVFVLTPDGAIARYLYGIDYAPRDLKLALLEASHGKTGSFGDRVLMRCFQYDPATRRYGLFISRFMKIGGFVMFLVVVAMIASFARHERRRARTEAAP